MVEGTCLCCGEPQSAVHFCPTAVAVVDPMAVYERQKNANPLERLTVGDWMQIEGEDAEEAKQLFEQQAPACQEEYLRGTLIYRVEIESLTGTGHQGMLICWAVAAGGHTDADLGRVLEFLNNPHSLVGVKRNEAYIFRLVSLNAEGIRYEWGTNKLTFNEGWNISAWS